MKCKEVMGLGIFRKPGGNLPVFRQNFGLKIKFLWTKQIKGIYNMTGDTELMQIYFAC